MKKTAVLIALLMSLSGAHAGKRIEICEEGDIVPGKGWVYQQVPCPVDAGEVAKEKACGKDYGELRIGMSVKRFEQCNEALIHETERVSKEGKVDIYRSTHYVIQAQNGRISSYQRRKF